MMEHYIDKYLMDNITPIAVGKGFYYRVSVYLSDNTYLPCVIFTNPRSKYMQARDKIVETGGDIVKLSCEIWPLIDKENQVLYRDLKRVEKCPYAWPKHLISQINNQVFTIVMKDGNLFGYYWLHTYYFLDLPNGYTYDDILEIHNGKIVTRRGKELDYLLTCKKLEGTDKTLRDVGVVYYLEKPFFICYSRQIPEYL